MTLGGSELQVFVTFLVILACAFVALLMDYLKGNNEQLRERHVDLLVRQEQYAGKAGIDAAVLARSLEQVLGQQTAALKEIVAESIENLPLRESPLSEFEEARKRGDFVSSLQDLPVWEIPDPKREAPSSEVEDGEQVKISLVPESELRPAEEESVISLFPAKVVPIRAEDPVPETENAPEAIEEIPEPAAAAHDFDRFLDDLVTEFEANPGNYPDAQKFISEEAAKPEAVPELGAVEVSGTAEQLAPLAAALDSVSKEVPAGVHPRVVLDELLSAPSTFSGVAVSVGINEFSELHQNLGKQAAEQLLGSVDALMEEMVRGKAFLCRLREDEFILLDPDLSGPYAQRRLNDISERLWDFQLRNLGSFSVVFSWGAHEANSENLREAVEAAQEKMRETQAARKSSSFEKLRRRLATA